MGCAALKLVEYDDMPMRPDVEEEVRSYLRDLRNDRGEVKKALQHLGDLYLLHEQKDEQRFTELGHLIRGQNARLDALERDGEETDRFIIDVQERRKWWKTVAGKITLKVIETLVVLAVGALIAHLTLR